jgi:hypothetical protein
VGLGLRLAGERQPAAVVLSLFTGNDEIDAARDAGSLKVAEGELLDAGTRLSAWRSLRNRIFLFSHLVRRLRNAPPLAAVARRFFGGPEPGPVRLLRRQLALYADPPPAEVERADRRIAGCLGRLKGFARERDIPVVAVLLPAEREVVAERLAAERAAVGAPAGAAGRGFDLDGPRRRLARLLDQAGLSYLDLRDPLARAVARGERPFFRHDGHLTAAGHALVAREIEAPLRRLLTTPASHP